MAKYTAGAYAGVSPIAEDFGGIAQHAADRNLQIQMQIGAIELQNRKDRDREIKEARDALLSDLREAEKYSREALDFQPANFSQEMMDTMVANTYKEVASRKRELQTAPPERRIQLNSELAEYSKNTMDFNRQMAAFQEWLGTIDSLRDKEGGWSSLTAMPIIKDLHAAIIGAGQGMTKNSDDTYNVGPRVKFSIGKSGEGIFDFHIGDKKISGTLPSIQMQIQGMLMQNPYVDTEKNFWGEAGKGIEMKYSQVERSLADGTPYFEQVSDKAGFEQAVGDFFDSQYARYQEQEYGNWPPVLKQVIMQGNLDDELENFGGKYTLGEVRKDYIEAAYARAKVSAQVKNAPPNRNPYSTIGGIKYADQKLQRAEAVRDRLLRIQGALLGNNPDKSEFVGTNTDLFVQGAREGTTKIASISNKDGKYVIGVHGISEQSKDNTEWTGITEYTFDPADPDAMDALFAELNKSANYRLPAEQQISSSDLRGGYNRNVSPVTEPTENVIDPASELGDAFAKVDFRVGVLKNYEHSSKNDSKTDERVRNENELSSLVNLQNSENGKNLSAKEVKDLTSEINTALKKNGYTVEVSGGRRTWREDVPINIVVKDKGGKKVADINRKSSINAIEDLKDFITKTLGTGRTPATRTGNWILPVSSNSVPASASGAGGTATSSGNKVRLNDF